MVSLENKARFYIDIMSSIIGHDVLDMSRTPRLVWSRYMVCHKMRSVGYGVAEIGRCIGIDHSTVSYGLKQVSEMLKMPKMYQYETRIWNRFEEILSLKKNDMTYEKNLDEN